MSEIKTIDPRGLEHHDREALIFPTIEELGHDETLRIIMEFNPVPLVYLLEARNEFEINYEKALFPRLEDHNIAEPSAIMKMDHQEFRKRKQMLHQLSHNHDAYSFSEFKKQCVELGEYLIRELENHIFKEDNIIYQIALQTLSKEEWEQVKKDCDRIGYCRFTPENQSDQQS
jgi:DUF438 domain-containing protein